MPSSSLRYQRSYLWIGRALLLAIVALSLLRLGPTGLPLPHGDKWGHLLAYFCVTAWYAQLVPAWPGLAWRALAFVALGGVIELLQARTGYRLAEWADLAADAMGVLLGFSVAFTPAGGLLRWLEQRLAESER